MTSAESHNLKDLDEAGLRAIVLRVESWDDDERAMVSRAYDLASSLHQDDMHKDNPYVFHLLRNAARAIQYLHLTNPQFIAAILLHDGVEDHSEGIVRTYRPDQTLPSDPQALRVLAFEGLAAMFSPRTSEIVAGLTNPLKPAGLTRQQSLDLYIEHARGAVVDPEVWAGKLVDWADNGLSIMYAEEAVTEEQRANFREKYGLLQLVLEARYYQPDIQLWLDPGARANVEAMFDNGRERLAV